MPRKIAGYTLFACNSLLFLLAVVSVHGADDERAKPVDKPAEVPATKPDAEQKPKERSLLEKLGDELLKEVDDTPGAPADPEHERVDKMERAVKGMRTAGQKLESGRTADETQKIQKQVIQDLADIINQLENPPPPNPNNSGGGGGGGGGGGAGGGGGGASGRNRRGGNGSSLRMRSPQRGGGQGSASQKQTPSGQNEEQDGGQKSDNAQDSSKMTAAERKAADEAARRRKLEMDIWGHLPEHVREELLNTYRDRMLPKYELMVKQFYEALSTQGDPKKK